LDLFSADPLSFQCAIQESSSVEEELRFSLDQLLEMRGADIEGLDHPLQNDQEGDGGDAFGQ
jgi:hypothetical protein